MTIKSFLKYSFFLLIFAFTITSCEDEIDIDVDPLTEQLVVDAWLNNKSEPQTIFLSMSQPYFDNSLPEGLSGAIVQVTSSTGTVFEFEEGENGNYIWTPTADETLGEIGTDYGLQITLDGKNYGSISTMNRVPAIDSLTYEFRNDETFGPDGIYTEFFARDLVGEGDTYWIKTFKNGDFLNKPSEINIAFDAGFSEGAAVDGLIFVPPIREATNRDSDPDTEDDGDVSPWAIGDEFKVEIHSLNLPVFFFLGTAQRQITNGNNGIFSEPVINTTGNILAEDGTEVLGIFNVAAVSEMTVDIE